jgi:hypothetical protein
MLLTALANYFCGGISNARASNLISARPPDWRPKLF